MRIYIKKYVVSFIVFTLLFVGSIPAISIEALSPQQEPFRIEWSEGEILVKFKDDVDLHLSKGDSYVHTEINSIDNLNEEYQVTDMDKIFKTAEKRTQPQYIKTYNGEVIEVPQLFNWYRLSIPEASNIQAIVTTYINNPNVEYAEPNYIAYACITPDDPLFGEQWGFVKIQAPDAWDIETGDTAVIIGILDTGIDTNHVDLANHIWRNTNETPDNGIDDDNNDYVDDVYGWNFVNDNNDVDDGAGHGSHCAGIVSAVTDNSIGVAGTSWDSKIMAVKVLNNNGVGLYSDIAQGINYTTENGAKVINMSFGGYVYSQLWEDALINAYQTSVLVGAAGNDNTQNLFYPACFDFVLGVAATDSLDIKWDGSNYGEWVNLSAPGVSILSTKLDDNYGYFTGTSEAAPFVSGVAALVASYKPTLSIGAIMNMITNNTDPIDSLNPGYAGMLGSGRLNAYKTLVGESFPNLVVYSDTIDDSSGDNDGIPDAGETVNLILTLLNKGTDATSVSAILHTDDIDITITDSIADFGDILARERKSNATDVFTLSVSDTCPQHDVLFKLYVDANGGSYNDTIEFSIATQNTYNVSGVISSNTTWQRGTYIVVGNVLLNPGVTLTIEPGVEVRVNAGLYIRVDGILQAIGSETDSIIFTKNSPSDRWGRLIFNAGSKGTLKYCHIAWSDSTSINGTVDSLYVGYCTICDNLGSGIDCIGNLNITHNNIYNDNYGIKGSGSIAITHNIIYNNILNGIDIHATGLSMINNNIITNNGGSGIRVAGNAVIDSNIVSFNGYAFPHIQGGGLKLHGLDSSPDSIIVSNNLILNNHAYMGGGIYDKVQKTAIIMNNRIINNYCPDTIPNGGGAGIFMNVAYPQKRKIIGNFFQGNISENYAGVVIWNGDAPDPGQAEIRNNLFVGNGNLASLVVDGNCSLSVYCNTIIDTNIVAIFFGSYLVSVTLHQNNIVADSLAVWNDNPHNITAENNWWGTTNTDTINAKIWDYYDDFNLGIVQYQPILTGPSQTASPYLDSLIVYPDPVGVETLFLNLTFSKPMNIGIAPKVMFGIAPDDTIFVVNGSWTDAKHWSGQYYINEMMIDSIYRIQVTDAEDDSGFAILPDQSHTFRVYTAGSASRELFAEPSWDKVFLHWHPANISNLLGYNMYRSETSGGPYTKINASVITDTLYTDYEVSGGTTYYYVYTILDNNFNESSYSSEASVYVEIEEESIKPTAFALYKIRPNPCLGKALIRYAVPGRTHIRLNIYDVQGRLVKTLIDRVQIPGYYNVVWNRTDRNNKIISSGVYFIKFEAENYDAVEKLLILR